MTELHFMRAALTLAAEAAGDGEVPVGAVVVRNGEIIATGRNRRETDKRAAAHAEMEAIDGACRALHGWRLHGCDLYVTLEPCPMCAGAIWNARLDRVFFGAYDEKAGACGTVFDLFAYPLNHRPHIKGGVLGSECKAMLQTFFQSLRKPIHNS